jgi:UDP-glucose 4-epimerase
MNALVTGGAGFIGSHLVDALLSRGDSVHVVDDFSTGASANLSDAREHADRFDLTASSVEACTNLDELVSNADVVFHLAAAVGVRLVVEQPVRTLETNLTATDFVLRVAARLGTPLFFASTSEVYGRSTRVEFSESDDLILGPPDIPRWGYACSKAFDEYLALAYAKSYDIPIVIGRLFNTVGPRQTGQYGMVLPTLVNQALSGENLTVYGDGQQTRCFCHVDDTVRAVIALMESHAARGEIFNVGSDEEVSIYGLASRIQKAASATSDIELVPYERVFGKDFEDMRRRKPDLRRIRARIGWKAEKSIDDIIESVIRYHQTEARAL